MKKFVAIAVMMVLGIMTMTAFAEIAYETITTEDGKTLTQSDVYINDDGLHEMDISVGDHWEIVFLAEEYGSTSGEWYSYYNGELAWFDKDYTGKGDSQVYFEFCMGLIVNYYYDGMEL